jgi:hypothetical protein
LRSAFGNRGLVGVIAIDTSAGGKTINVAELLVMLPDTALIVVDPVSSDWTSPVAPADATAPAEELHVTALVRFCVLLSV